MITQKVISPIKDDKIKSNLLNSPIWKECYHEDEELPQDKELYCYTIRFDGLTPIQLTKLKKYKLN
jgi:hypothetical protein